MPVLVGDGVGAGGDIGEVVEVPCFGSRVDADWTGIGRSQGDLGGWGGWVKQSYSDLREFEDMSVCSAQLRTCI